MNLSPFSKIIEATFTDVMDVYRYTTIDNDDKTTDTVLPSLPIIENKPCRVSFIKLENASNASIDRTPILYMPKLFFRVSEDVIVGDYIEVKRIAENGETLSVYKGNIGLPAVFVTHKEALFAVDGEA